jgi:hypothetical protein
VAVRGHQHRIISSDLGRNQRLQQSARSSVRGSFYQNMEMSNVPLPSLLKNYNEVLSLIVNDNTQAAIEMLKKLKVQEVVDVRGLNLLIQDIEFEHDQVETLMWNPLHFAVYY